MFWKTYPLSRLWESLWNREVFLPQPVDKEPLVPPGEPMTQITRPEEVTEVRVFLRTYFGNPPHTPVLDMPEETLCGIPNHLFAVRAHGAIVGTIRYHYLGEFVSSTGEPIYAVDCFCIHPTWRRRGLGDYLLTALHQYVHRKGIPYSMFLKEGASVRTPSFYTGTYAYRETGSRPSRHLRNLTVEQAHQWMDVVRQIHPLFVIRNVAAPNQRWKGYRKGMHSVLACVQDTYQSKEGKRMAWVTAWIESPGITDAIRSDAADAIADDLPEFEYVWMNSLWSGCAGEWKEDGPFHWYTYQWTSVPMGRSYAISV